MTAERKHRARLALFGGMTLAVMILIFWFSAQNGASSRAMSEGFLKTLLGTLAERFLPRLSGKGIDWDIRKYAHMGEYFCLGLSAFLFFSELTRWRGKGERRCSRSRGVFFTPARTKCISFLFPGARGACATCSWMAQASVPVSCSQSCSAGAWNTDNPAKCGHKERITAAPESWGRRSGRD